MKLNSQLVAYAFVMLVFGTAFIYALKKILKKINHAGLILSFRDIYFSLIWLWATFFLGGLIGMIRELTAR